MNKKLIFLFFSICLVLSVFSFANIAKAQPAGQLEVYVKDLTLSKTEYKAGETVSGSFTLWNARDMTVPNVHYVILLMGNYKNSLPTTQYDITSQLGSFFLSSKEKKVVNFTYKLPESVSGDGLGLQVRAVLDTGASLGWADAMIKVTGGTGIATIKTANIKISKNIFGLQEGPVIYENSTGTLNIILKNDTAKEIQVTPDVSIYDRSESRGILGNYKQAKISISPKSEYTFTYELPTFNYTPKVYVGRVEFKDDSGVERAPKVDFRYIVGGDIATINSISADKTSVGKGETVILDVNYSGSPFDILTGKTLGTAGFSDFDLKLFNQKDILVGEYSDKADFNKNSDILLTLNTTGSATALRAEMSVTKNGKVLTKYSTNLSSDYEQKKNETDWSGYFSAKTILAILLVLILIISLIFIKTIFKNKIILALVLLMIIGIVITLFFVNKTKAWVLDSCSGTWDDRDLKCYGSGDAQIYDVFVNSPLPYDPSGSNYVPGQPYYLLMSATANACSNHRRDFQIFSGTLASNIIHREGEVCTSNCSNVPMTFSSLSLGPFYAPAIIGAHTINFEADIAGYADNNFATLKGHQDFSVVSLPAPTVIATAGSSCSSGIHLSWNAVNYATSYKIFRDGVLISTTSATSTNDTGIDPSTRYTYTVKASNSVGDSALSNTVSATSATCRVDSGSSPNPVSAASVLSAGTCGGKINISWATVPYATSYQVFRDASTTPFITIISPTNFPATSTVDIIATSTPHFYQVQAFGNFGSYSVISSSSNATTSTGLCLDQITTRCYTKQNGSETNTPLATSTYPVTWKVDVLTGGMLSYNYQWSGSVSGSGPSSSTIYYLGPKDVNSFGTTSTVIVSSNYLYHREATTSCSITVYKSFNNLENIRCSVSPTNNASSTYVNKSISWNAVAPISPAFPLYNIKYSWTGDDEFSSFGSLPTSTKIYTTLGIKHASATITGTDDIGALWTGACSTSTNITLEAGAGGSVEH